MTDTVTRASLGAARRKPWSQLFFDGALGIPLEKPAAGAYEIPLEMVRRGPSATNKQPWRIEKNDGAFHFFLQRTAGYTRMTSAADLQRIDMGIAIRPRDGVGCGFQRQKPPRPCRPTAWNRFPPHRRQTT